MLANDRIGELGVREEHFVGGKSIRTFGGSG